MSVAFVQSIIKFEFIYRILIDVSLLIIHPLIWQLIFHRFHNGSKIIGHAGSRLECISPLSIIFSLWSDGDNFWTVNIHFNFQYNTLPYRPEGNNNQIHSTKPNDTYVKLNAHFQLAFCSAYGRSAQTKPQVYARLKYEANRAPHSSFII